MKIEELEDLWNAQRPVGPVSVDGVGAVPVGAGAGEFERNLARELGRRSRMFAYGYFFLTLGLVVVPLLAVVNFNYARPENVLLFVLNALVGVTVSVSLLVGMIRRHRRHRALAQAKAESIADFLAVSIENLEAEMQDFRVSRWGVMACLGISLLAIYVNHPIPRFGWGPFGIRAAMVLGSMVLLLSVVARHCRKNLQPELERRKEMLERLS